MNVSEATAWWAFDPDLLSSADLIVCPSEEDGCGEASPLLQWREGSIGCSECGEHIAIVCPACDGAFGHVWGPTFDVVRADG